MKKVGIIGGSGFIGSYITKFFLKENFKVKVSVTDIFKNEKYEHLFNLNNADFLNISMLDIQNTKDLKGFVKDCDIVIHGGTPFQLDVKDPKSELLDPTIKGTENFLEVIKESPTIKKVVFIASVAAYNTNFPMPADGKKPQDSCCEYDIPFFSEDSHPYAQAKFIANQTVEDFIQNNPKLHFEITSVSPVAVMGKSLSTREDSTSIGLQFLFKNKIAPNPFIQSVYDKNVVFAMVEVRDVAEGVFKAGTISGLHGKNYLLSSESYPVSDITLMLNNKPPINLPKIIYQNKIAEQELGVHFKPVIEALQQYNT